MTIFVKGSGSQRNIRDYVLSRYAYYLIVQNGDPRKGLRETEKILDHMESVELAANLFRITQIEEKLVRDIPRA